MQILGIIGISFCGSTYLARLLDQLEGYVSPGEPHWLVDEPTTKRSLCRHGACDAVDALRAVPPSPETLYNTVAYCLNGGELPAVFVSADKHWYHFPRFVKPWDMCGVVLYKSPEGHALSEAKHNMSLWRDAVDEWTSFYLEVMSWSERHGEVNGHCSRTRYVCYDDLAANPVAMVRTLLRELGLPGASSLVNPDNLGDGHIIGGNPGGRVATAGYHDRDWVNKLSLEAQGGIQDYEPAQRVLRELEAKKLRV